MALNPQNSIICPLAWNHLFVNIGGEVQVCCISEEVDNAIRGSDGKPLNIKTVNSLGEVLNSDFMKKIRLQMSAGEWPSLCQRCKITEEHGGVSIRQMEWIKQPETIAKIEHTPLSDGTIEPSLRSADLRLGNSCNLACRMCNPRPSSKWASDWKKISHPKMHIADDYLEMYRSQDWTSDLTPLYSTLKDSLDLKTLHFAGGEPLFMKEMQDILQSWIDKGVSKEIIVTYNTNFTQIPKRTTELWKQFKGVKLLISLDGAGEVNEYIRHPSKWSTIQKNFQDLDDHFREWNIIEAKVSCTVQALNIGRLSELYAFLQGFHNIDAVPGLIALHMPEMFSIRAMPKELKREASREIQKIRSTFAHTLRQNQKGQFYADLEVMEEFMKQDDSHLWQEFIAINEQMDVFKKQKLKEILPQAKKDLGHYFTQSILPGLVKKKKQLYRTLSPYRFF